MWSRREAEGVGPGEPYLGNTAWLRAEAFDSLLELNAKALGLLAEQAVAQPSHGNLLVRQVGEVWRTLDGDARRRAAACPYLLLDVGFAEPRRWQWIDGQHVSERLATPYSSFFTVPGAVSVAREVFLYAWHLARARHTTAQILIGMPPRSAQLISTCTLSQIHELAERHPGWLRPRWLNRNRFWRELLQSAASGEVVALENARMHGLQLLAAECRAAALQVS